MSTQPGLSPRTSLRRTLVVLLVAILVIDRSAVAMAPWLATHHPLLLVAVDPTDKAVLLAVKVSLVTLFPVALARRLIGQSLYFFIGRRLGHDAKEWLTARGYGGLLSRFERAVRRWSYPAVLVAPRDIVCILAGDLGMGWAPFLLLAAVRDITMVLVLRQLSQTFARQIDSVLSFLNTYTVPATLVAVGVVVLQFAWQSRRRRALTAPAPAAATAPARAATVPAPAPAPASADAAPAGAQSRP
ncbi:MAG TPA: hypothetical protein VNF50_12665 [Acidimicrobiales bacterium]|nr:hypothetical protein [Acidimicrobiales bacterium]